MGGHWAHRSVRASAAAAAGEQARGQADEQVIEISLAAVDDQTIVVWEERGMPLDLLSAYGAGVQIHVEDLADHLAGRERRDDAKTRWDELHPAYQDLAAKAG